MKKHLLIATAFLLITLAGCVAEPQPPAEKNDSSAIENSAVSSDTPPNVSSPSTNSLPDEEESTLPEESRPEEPAELNPTENPYVFTSVENGKTVATVFSEAQVKDIVQRRESGEWLCLSVQDIKAIVTETAKLFEDFDLVRVRNLHGEVHIYYGWSFYDSQEYLNCFNCLSAEGDPRSTFDLQQDICDSIFARVELLHSAVSTDFKVFGRPLGEKVGVVLLGEEQQIDKAQLDEQVSAVYLGYKNNSAVNYEGSAVLFEKDWIDLIEDASRMKTVELFPASAFAGNAGKYEYGNPEKVVVAEVREYQSNDIVARVRIDDTQQLAKIEGLWNKLATSTTANPTTGKDAPQYYAIVYFNGFDGYFGGMANSRNNIGCIMYFIEDGQMKYSLADAATTKAKIFFMSCTCSDNGLGEYLNAIIADVLT